MIFSNFDGGVLYLYYSRAPSEFLSIIDMYDVLLYTYIMSRLDIPHYSFLELLLFRKGSKPSFINRETEREKEKRRVSITVYHTPHTNYTKIHTRVQARTVTAISPLLPVFFLTFTQLSWKRVMWERTMGAFSCAVIHPRAAVGSCVMISVFSS